MANIIAQKQHPITKMKQDNAAANSVPALRAVVADLIDQVEKLRTPSKTS